MVTSKERTVGSGIGGYLQGNLLRLGLLDINNPGETSGQKVTRILEELTPKEAYLLISRGTQSLGRIYCEAELRRELERGDFQICFGGKAAGRILSSYYLRELDLEERIREKIAIPRGFAVRKASPFISVLFERLEEEGITEVIVRSSATEEDTFEENWAGLGLTERMQVTDEDEAITEFIRIFREGESALGNLLLTDYTVVVDEFKPIKMVAVVHSDSLHSRGKTDVTCYFREEDKDIVSLYSRGIEIGDTLSMVDKRNHRVLTIPRTFPYSWSPSQQPFGEIHIPLFEYIALRSALNMVEGKLFSERDIRVARELISRGRQEQFEEYQNGIIGKQPTGQQIQEMAKIARAYEKRLGFKVDIEIGIDDEGRYNLFQLRPLIQRNLKARTEMPAGLKNVIFATQVVNNEFSYQGQLYIKPDNSEGLEALAKVFTPSEIRAQVKGHDAFLWKAESALSSLGGNRFRYSTIQIGTLRKGEVTYVSGHGEEHTIPAPLSDRLFIHPLIWPFVMAVGEEVREGTYMTPFDVQIISDGRVGIISIPGNDDYKRFREIAERKISEYETGLDKQA